MIKWLKLKTMQSKNSTLSPDIGDARYVWEKLNANEHLI